MSPLRTGFDLPPERLAELCQRYSVSRLSLFGSVLRDDFHAGSDVDMLVEFDADAEVGYFAMMRLQEELTDMSGRQVDLRTPGELSRHFRTQVVREAMVLYPLPDPCIECERGLAPSEYPVWSPYDATEASIILTKLLSNDAAQATSIPGDFGETTPVV